MKYQKLLLPVLMACMAEPSFAALSHCKSSYENQPFNRAVISPADKNAGHEYGWVECVYKNDIYYDYPRNQTYIGIGGDWEVTMPDIYYCSVENPGNSAKTCTFQLIETKW